jgi:antirestriction protein
MCGYMSNERVAGVEGVVGVANETSPRSPLGVVSRLGWLAPGSIARAEVMLLPEVMVKSVECEVGMMEECVMTRADGWGTFIRTLLRNLFTPSC